MDQKKELITYVDNLLIFFTGIFLFVFPLVFTNLTTDAFSVPKELASVVFVTLAVLLLVIKMLLEKRVEIRRTPFNLPIFLFMLVAVASSLLSINRFDSLFSTTALFFAVATFFVIINTIRKESHILFLLYAIGSSAAIVSALAVLSYFKIYILPFSFTQFQTFSPVGSLLDQALFLGVALTFCLSIIWPIITGKQARKFGGKEIFFASTSIVSLVGLAVTISELLFIQQPTLLPYLIGFQTAMASISQESGRTIQNLLFGSGFGTYSTVFTRFKQASINVNPALWSLIFFRSSSFLLDILATTGILGFASFVLILIKGFRFKKELSKPGRNMIFVSLLVVMVFSIFLPLSFVGYMFFFITLGVFSAIMGLFHKEAFSLYEEQSKILTVIIALLVVVCMAVVDFGVFRFMVSDFLFQRSLATSPSDGGQIYDLQNRTIGQFPYRDTYFRVFSVTNLSLANSILANQPKNASPSAETQNTVITLTQQSINAARAATSLAPLTSSNWVNLAAIYRSLIGFGQDAETYAVLALQRAISLDPNNPQLYLDLGSVYYQLKLWDEAQRQFAIATQLKPDFANAYYNLGHALEEKGDLQNALVQYKTVKTLVANDKNSTKQIDDEIKALETRIGSSEQNGTQAVSGTAENQPPLEIATPSAQLPARKPPVDIPSPDESPTPTPGN